MSRKYMSFSANLGGNAYSRSARASMANIIRNYRKFIERVEEVMPEVIYDALEPTFEKSKVYCPKDTGALVNSGYLEITSTKGVPRVEIGYGRDGTPEYTAKVHENLEYRHKAPTRAKWLQIALEEDAQKIQNYVVLSLRV